MKKLCQCKAFIIMLVFMVIITTFQVCGSFFPSTFNAECFDEINAQSNEELTSQSIYQRDQSLTLGYSGMLKNICFRNAGTNVDSQSQVYYYRVFKLFLFAMLFGIALFPKTFYYIMFCIFAIPNAEQRHMIEVLQDKDGKKR